MTSHFLLSAALLIFPAGMALAASMDLLTMTIPNRICLAIALGFFLFAAVACAPLPLVLWNLSCAAIVLLVTFSMFTIGWIGGGDAKLAAAAALWVGWGSLLDFGLTTAICGGVLGVVLLAARRMVLPPLLTRISWIANLHKPKTGVPYGIALAVAAIVIFPQTALVHSVGA